MGGFCILYLVRWILKNSRKVLLKNQSIYHLPLFFSASHFRTQTLTPRGACLVPPSAESRSCPGAVRPKCCATCCSSAFSSSLSCTGLSGWGDKRILLDFALQFFSSSLCFNDTSEPDQDNKEKRQGCFFLFVFLKSLHFHMCHSVRLSNNDSRKSVERPTNAF